jgi:hypothetical protein
LLNLASLSGQPLGYWVTNSAGQINSSGEIVSTNAQINHSPFSSISRYGALAGSGVKDIHQNCFLPSGGPGCTPTQLSPSCCNGAVTAGSSCP